jgi:hypothetical protein
MSDPVYYDLYSSTKLEGSATTAKTSVPSSSVPSSSLHKTATGKEHSTKEKSTKEGFSSTNDVISDKDKKINMTNTNLADTNLTKNWNEMHDADKYDFTSKVEDPHGYGYVASLEEVRNQDTQSLLTQENQTFIAAAVAGISAIVLGIMLTAGQPA